VSKTPSKVYVFAGAVLALLGLLASLFIRRRRMWVRVSDTDGGRTVVAVAGLDRGDGGDLAAEVDSLVGELTTMGGVTTSQLPQREDVP
jgi:cytochrome c biogenesis protein